MDVGLVELEADPLSRTDFLLDVSLPHARRPHRNRFPRDSLLVGESAGGNLRFGCDRHAVLLPGGDEISAPQIEIHKKSGQASGAHSRPESSTGQHLARQSVLTSWRWLRGGVAWISLDQYFAMAIRT